jgi:hypothetical protein
MLNPIMKTIVAVTVFYWYWTHARIVYLEDRCPLESMVSCLRPVVENLGNYQILYLGCFVVNALASILLVTRLAGEKRMIT